VTVRILAMSHPLSVVPEGLALHQNGREEPGA